MNEKWIQWKPTTNLAKKYYINSIMTKKLENKFTLILSDADKEGKKVLISFLCGVDAYRNTEETYTYATIDWLHDKYGVDFYGAWTFFKIENSAYIKWLLERPHISDTRNLIHFCILGVDSVIDIIATYEPTVTFLE